MEAQFDNLHIAQMLCVYRLRIRFSWITVFIWSPQLFTVAIFDHHICLKR